MTEKSCRPAFVVSFRMSRHIVIIGNGVAGVTAARFIRKLSDDSVTVISGEAEHFYARTALMYVFMGHLRYKDTKPYEDWFWTKNRINLLQDVVGGIDTDEQTLHLLSGDTIRYDVLLVATGSRPRKPGCRGENLPGVQGLYGMPDLELLEANTKNARRAVVVGGGLIGIELAEMLHSRGIPVTFLVREPGYMGHVLPPEESEMVGAEILEHHVDLRLSTGLAEILPGDDGRVRAVVTTAEEEIPCDFVGLTIGVEPNIDVVRSSQIETGVGVLVNEFFETSVPGVYAAGDCAEFRDRGVGRQAVEQLWYTARQHGKVVAHTICGIRTPYRRGMYFNSAKFFDLEYQTYGNVPALPEPGIDSLFWKDPTARRSVRIAYEQLGNEVLGFNVFGVRFRQDVCERWIVERRTIDYVLRHLHEANFDPEFTRRFEREVRQVHVAPRGITADRHRNGEHSVMNRLLASFRPR